MADPLEVWRLMWATAMSRGIERLAEVLPASSPSVTRVGRQIDLSQAPTFERVRIDLSTLRLFERPAAKPTSEAPILIVGPYAVHESSIADFARGHSIAEVLASAGSGLLALAYWKSATDAMRNFGIDAYLADLNVAVDDLGGRVSLVGLCQGGWLSAAYAARFPAKVEKLVLVGAPADTGAAPSQITQSLALVSPEMIAQVLALCGGRVSGALSFALWSDTLVPGFSAEDALQCANERLAKRFDAWNAKAVDLPGVYFAQTTEWIFRENRLARDCFPALGRNVGLSGIEAPIYVLAADNDEIVSLPQATAVKPCCRGTNVTVRIEPGRHLSLFMGRHTLRTAWPEIAEWLKKAARSPLRPHRDGKANAGTSRRNSLDIF